LYELSFGQFLLVLVTSAAVSMVVFAHADKHGNRHATAWGIATFLALGIAVPLYFIRYWLRTRRRS
jgi:glycerol uptake facilitator-like aquaporin